MLRLIKKDKKDAITHSNLLKKARLKHVTSKRGQNQFFQCTC